MNPFLRRATEYIRDTASFLQITSPEPLELFIGKHPRLHDLLDLPVRIIGSPGAGKTMLASLVEFRTLEAVLLDQVSQGNRDLAKALTAANFADGDRPKVAAVRIPMESEYRDFWELPYDPAIKTKLMLALIQSRAVIGLFRGLVANGQREFDDVRFVIRPEAEAQLVQIGGATSAGLRNRAREVERAVYAIGSSLLPPSLADIPLEASAPYQPFEAIKEIEIEWDGATIAIRPLVILDDVHNLHPDQLAALLRALARREIRIGRWMMMRMDSLSPHEVLRSADEDFGPGIKPDRDFIDIYIQNSPNRSVDRRRFRSMAGDMANRYLKLVNTLGDRGHESFAPLLLRTPPKLSAAVHRDLMALLDRDQTELEIAPSRRELLAEIVTRYAKGARSKDLTEDVRAAMLRVLMHRHAGRVAGMTLSLFDDPEPRVEVKAKPQIADAAKVHLHHLFDRPLHYGIDDLCDASGENAELFLQLAGSLVEKMEAKVIRKQSPSLTPQQQSEVLEARARWIIDHWSFPYARKVRALVKHLAERCVENSLLPNAPLGGGANTLGILESEFQALLKADNETLAVLKFAIAYGAMSAVRNYGQGGKQWCLLELSGLVCLAYGLDMGRGSFLEGSVSDVESAIEDID